MPKAQNSQVFEQSYRAAVALLDEGDAPTRHVMGRQFVYRSVLAQYLPKPAPGQFPSQQQQNAAVSPFDENRDDNRWSGKSASPIAKNAGGLYCVLQQQALVNEVMHSYRGQKGPVSAFDPESFSDKAIVKIRLNRTFFCLDLSKSNPHAQHFLAKVLAASGAAQTPPGQHFPFVNELQLQRILSASDCSIPRAIGLAAAACSYLHGLITPTMRFSDRSIYERGDNIVFFGSNLRPIPNLTVEEILYS